MRCTTCGMPLSPLRTNAHCPRCGSPVSAGQSQRPATTVGSQNFDEAPYPFPTPPGTPIYGSGGSAAGDHLGSPLLGGPGAQGVQDAPAVPLQASVYVEPGARETRVPAQPWPGGPGAQQGQGARLAVDKVGAQWQPRGSARSVSASRLGFTIAALCVITGGLILVFVYFLAVGAPGNTSAGNTNGAHTTSSQATQQPSVSPTRALSPTATAFPGQQYIYNAQMASTIDASTGKATQPTTTFQINQKIYVTFQLHPAVHGGAVCLLWYLNNRQVTSYDFPVSQHNSASYSYAIYGGAGAGAVELYWASTTTCADKSLAQRVSFTVT